MSYEIKTVAWHRAQMEDTRKRAAERAERSDWEDRFLSDWAGDCMLDYHKEAIDALNLGAANGFDGPAMRYRHLATAEGALLRFKGYQTRFGFRYKVELPNGATKWVDGPTKRNGLRWATYLVPARRYLDAQCSGRGMPMFFRPVPDFGPGGAFGWLEGKTPEEIEVPA